MNYFISHTLINFNCSLIINFILSKDRLKNNAIETITIMKSIGMGRIFSFPSINESIIY